MRSSNKWTSLTNREREVALLLSQTDGIRNKQIAHKLGISEKTTKTYRASLMRKLDVIGLVGLVRIVDSALQLQKES